GKHSTFNTPACARRFVGAGNKTTLKYFRFLNQAVGKTLTQSNPPPAQSRSFITDPDDSIALLFPEPDKKRYPPFLVIAYLIFERYL
ncbi:MAG TPA: hypothetical protein VIU13_10275, partial [Chryseolinea sp.]